MIWGILRQLRRARNLLSSIWKPGGSLKHSNNGAALVCISNSCAISIIGCIVLLSENPQSFMSCFPKVIAVGLADADVCPSQQIIAKLVLSCSLVRRINGTNAPRSTPFFLFFGIPVYKCVEVERVFL